MILWTSEEIDIWYEILFNSEIMFYSNKIASVRSDITFSFATIKCVDVRKHRTLRMYSKAVLLTSTKLPTFFGSSEMSLKMKFLIKYPIINQKLL